MRLWHRDLLPVLPEKQLLSQWRECCSIAKGISKTGKTNHILINRIMDYPLSHFVYYTGLVAAEMEKRGYKVNTNTFTRYGLVEKCEHEQPPTYEELFKDWHNSSYYLQCYFNLEEKYECGGIPKDEWLKIKWRGLSG